MIFRKTALWMSAVAVIALSGCNSSDVLDVSRKASAPLPQDVVRVMKAKGMTKSSPIMMRIFKEDAVLEVWKQKNTGRYDLVKTYKICAYSGKPGPKYKEGDRQAPEGFYMVNRGLMNPYSSYYLSFNLGFPNAYDRSHGRNGTNLMVHGACSSAGCYSMTDEQISEIYAFARDALEGGQDAFQVQAFPFRMTAENMAKHRDDPHFEYWTMIKEGYDHFELTKTPPKVDVCEKKYVFNRAALSGEFSPTQACPEMEMPQSLSLAYSKMQANYALEFEKALAKLEKRKVRPLEAPQEIPAPVAAAAQIDQLPVVEPVPEPVGAPAPLPETRPAQ